MLEDTGQSQAVTLLHIVFILAQSKPFGPLFRVLPIVHATAEGHFMLKSNLHFLRCRSLVVMNLGSSEKPRKGTTPHHSNTL